MTAPIISREELLREAEEHLGFLSNLPGVHPHRIARIREALTAPAQGAVNPADDTTVSCARFVRWALQEGPWEGGDLDGGNVQDKAETLGLIVSVPYDPEKHGAYNNCGCDAGDPWFEFSPGLNAVKASPLPSTGLPAPAPHDEVREALEATVKRKDEALAAICRASIPLSKVHSIAAAALCSAILSPIQSSGAGK